MIALTLISLSLTAAASIPQQSRAPEPTQPEPAHSWRFKESGFTGGIIADGHGELDLNLVKGGLSFTGTGRSESVLLHEEARPLDLMTNTDPSKVLPGRHFSIATWIRVDKHQPWSAAFSAIADDGDFERGLAAGCNGDRFFLGLVGTNGDDRITYLFSDTRAETGRWHHLVATYDGSTMRLYVDGTLDVEDIRESGDVMWPEETTIALGSYVDSNERHHLHGALHSVLLYDTTLDEHEIALLHARDAAAFPEPRAPEDTIASRPEGIITGWPTYRRDARRSGATAEPLPLPLTSSWTHKAPSVPRPSWPEPALSSYWQSLPEIVPRVVFDKCFQPVSNGEVVLYGSSADDHVRCIDIETGEVRWVHATNGPIRFAPVIDGEGVIVASDDGTVRRLDIEDGALLWSRDLSPEDARMVGNGRIISAWPIRTGPVIDRGLLSITVGLFPRFGTWAATLDAETGELLWRTELPGISPQGYLLASPRRLFVPTGRTSPIMLGRSDGRSLGRFEGGGGTFAILVEDDLITGPGSRGRLELSGQASRETIAGFDANHAVVVEDLIVLARDESVGAIDRPRLLDVVSERRKLEKIHADLLVLREQGENVEQRLEETAARLLELKEELLACELWSRDLKATCLVLAGDMLVVGVHDEVILVDRKTGEERSRLPTEGTVHGLAVAGDRIIASTNRGRIHCFATSEAPAITAEQPTSMPALDESLVDSIRAAGMDRGLAIITSASGPGLGIALSNALPLHVVIIEPDLAKADAMRREILPTGMYGDRVVVMHADPLQPGIEEIANVLIDETGNYLDDAKVLGRVVRPAGGVYFPGTTAEDTLELTGFTTAEAGPRTVLIRNALEGAGDWTHPYADAANTAGSGDTRIAGEFGLRWFGGPGAQRMVDRHLRTTASLATGGRIFVPGNDVIIGMDAYNGMELWSTPLPGFTRTGAPYDGGWWAAGDAGVIAAVGEQAVVLDPRNGTITSTFEVPTRAREACGPIDVLDPRCEWGWLATDGVDLFGSAALPGTARLEQDRPTIVDQYSDTQALATSRALFSTDRATGRTNWVYSEGLVVNATIAMRDGRIIFLQSMADEAMADLDGRVPLSTLRNGSLSIIAIDSQTGRKLWRMQIDGSRFDHSVFIALSEDHVIITGSRNGEKAVQYHVAAHDPATGKELWRAEHANNREIIGGDHGEQVHHPVILDEIVIAEPHAYELATGNRVDSANGDGFYLRSRSGCGTISASSHCLFFRDGNPAFLDLTSGSMKQGKLTQASRQGCWVNVIPAQGMVLIPESSSGCVCGYSLQTSLGLYPINESN